MELVGTIFHLIDSIITESVLLVNIFCQNYCDFLVELLYNATGWMKSRIVLAGRMIADGVKLKILRI